MILMTLSRFPDRQPTRDAGESTGKKSLQRREVGGGSVEKRSQEEKREEKNKNR